MEIMKTVNGHIISVIWIKQIPLRRGIGLQGLAVRTKGNTNKCQYNCDSFHFFAF